LTRDIFSNYRVGESKVTLEMNLPKLYLDVDKVIPCGLITNELVTNALKHAFPEGREGTLYVGIDADTTPGRIMLVIKDNGVGLPDDFDINTTRSL
ncbi:MAG: histidine kinase, partial [candidate division Zixibacteria bacterium]|nr:sensor histidine kinase [candidate division Zixibacteria bacterium]NIR63615.1 sensor histidine kinase [candidate division Zixibacteria bacterium]NIS45586.1 sensor histidine kinase [candidate division Zixibacteria bacterium]NIU13703.1 sensor histidine kinase [candidate division Zixibacteria bacterium]NIV05752.1 histidine kinase [candidate division Zixibacteria bacterium]